MKHQSNNNFFAEILESNITTWQAQCWQWNHIPEFGSLVTIGSGNKKLFGIIYDITTGPIDPIRQPVPYQKTEAELVAEQPQIFEFLKTSFTCIAVGYEENNKIYYTIPAQPPKMHAFIAHATEQEYTKYFQSNDFLYLLFTSSLPIHKEELLLAIIHHQVQQKSLTKEGFDHFIKTFFMMNKNNYLQTKAFISRIQNLIL
jgi:hypothetical protein